MSDPPPDGAREPEEPAGTPLTGRTRATPDPPATEGGETPATGWVRTSRAEQSVGAEPDLEITPATGWVIAGSRPPAGAGEQSTASSLSDAVVPVAAGGPAGWPQPAAISWAHAPLPAGAVMPAPRWAPPPAGVATRPRGRSWLTASLAALVLALLVVASGGLGFAAGARPVPTPTPRAQPTLQPTLGPIGNVDSALITLRLPAGWLEQQQSGTDVRLVDFPDGYMDINVQSTTAVGATTPQAVLLKAQQDIRNSSKTVGLVSTCVQPAAHTIAGRAGVEQGFQFQEWSSDGKTLFTNCALDWAAVENGEVYFWEVFNTLDQLKASTTAANTMQRSAHWQE